MVSFAFAFNQSKVFSHHDAYGKIYKNLWNKNIFLVRVLSIHDSHHRWVITKCLIIYLSIAIIEESPNHEINCKIRD